MIVKSPLAVFLPRKTKADRKCYVNLNNYRNWHHKMSNDVKTEYVKAIKDQIDGVKFENPITLTLTFFKSQNRRTDRANVLSVTEKFFCDALVECGCIPDDNDDVILWTHYQSGGKDAADPRVEIEIAEVAQSVL